MPRARTFVALLSGSAVRVFSPAAPAGYPLLSDVAIFLSVVGVTKSGTMDVDESSSGGFVCPKKRKLGRPRLARAGVEVGRLVTEYRPLGAPQRGDKRH